MEEIVEKILKSKKYSAIDPKTVEYLYANLAEKYPEKILEEKLKSLLHQIWGAYYSTRPNFGKLLQKNKELLADPKTQKDTLLKLLRLHSSTAERISEAESFYKQIFSITQLPKTILDHGCGLNPLFYPWMDFVSGASYFAYDIDVEEIDFLKAVVDITKPKIKFSFNVGNVLFGDYPEVDVVFMFKLLPVIEQQAQGATLEIIRRQKAKYIVVSFPLKTLSGREVGMAGSYSQNFERMASENCWVFTKIEFPNELVYVIKK